jgi:hypothetical protein
MSASTDGPGSGTARGAPGGVERVGQRGRRRYTSHSRSVLVITPTGL